MTRTLGHIIADFETSLDSKISVGATSATLLTNVDKDGVTLPNGQYLFTISGNDSTKEYIKGTLTGTAITNIKSVSRQGVLTTGVSREHRKNSSVIISNFPDSLFLSNLLDGTTDLDSLTPLKYGATATISNNAHIATKLYADSASIATGYANASASGYGVSFLSTGPVSATGPIILGDNDPRLPTQSENDAMVGSSGTASSSNRYVTSTDPNMSNNMGTAGTQTIGGVKTFSSLVIIPTGATASNHWVTKSYVDSV